ncbi:hypothetical protein PIB30_060743 [Stylosanthes scabra]|uniref:hAT-like transposase RNase-H fold domain-containing protein n=1 Tax=Stylosanthes scabra TaxID=79078 RepID=A0ABU6SL10_9FABA|nr:hypothetical protein [Stylosanthes scabra]
MAEKMFVKFKKYWDEYSVALAFGAIFDPRFKINTLFIAMVKLILTSQGSSVISQVSSPSTSTAPIRLIKDLMSRNQEAEVKSGKNQLDVYLNEATLFCNDVNKDVLQWWKDKSMFSSTITHGT